MAGHDGLYEFEERLEATKTSRATGISFVLERVARKVPHIADAEVR